MLQSLRVTIYCLSTNRPFLSIVAVTSLQPLQAYGDICVLSDSVLPCCHILLQPEGEDELKRRQLMELAIINGTYRDTKSGSNPQIQTNGTSPPSSLSPLGGTPSHPAAIAAAVASRKWHGVVTPSMLCL